MTDQPAAPIEILIVEDSAIEIELLRRSLDRAGYRPVLTKHGAEALAAARAHRPALIVSDIEMPEMNGFQLCQAIKDDDALWTIPVILMSVLSEPEDILRAINSGADGYLVKPYVQEALLERIRALLAMPTSGTRTDGRRRAEVQYNGESHSIVCGDRQVLNLLLSIYVNSLNQNRDLVRVQTQLNDLNDDLERQVRERTGALRESEEHYRSALVALADGVLIYSRQGTLITANPAAERILGFGTDALRMRPPDDECWRPIRADGSAFPSDEWPLVSTLRTGIPQRNVPMGLIKPDDSVAWILVSSEPIRDPLSGQLQAVAVSFHDITARRAAEEALEISLAEARRHDAEMVALNQMNHLLLSCETSADAYQTIADSAAQLFPGYSGALAVLGEDNAADLQVVATWGDNRRLPATFPLDDCWALRRGEIHEVTDPLLSHLCRHLADRSRSDHLCIPLIVRNQPLGLLQLSAPAAPTDAQFGNLRTLAIAVSEAAKLALSNIRLRETLREQAIRDPLTGLFNRRYLDETLPRELHGCQRRGEPLALAMLDLDHFKRLNDSYGHEAGDQVLREIGALLNRFLRAGDLACRYGGEELTLILTGATLADAHNRLEGLRQAVMQLRVTYRNGDLPPITVSIGIAVSDGREIYATALLAQADAAMYEAKKGGRNRVMSISADASDTAIADSG